MKKIGNVIMYGGLCLFLLAIIDFQFLPQSTFGWQTGILSSLLVGVGAGMGYYYDKTHCSSCKDGKLVFVNELIVNNENTTKKVVDREYTKDMSGNKVSYTDKVNYVNQNITTKEQKFECNKCGKITLRHVSLTT